MNTSTIETSASRFWAKYTPSRSIALDMVERVLILVMFGFFAAVNLGHLITTLDVRSLMLVISESLPLLLVALRPPSPTLSDKPIDWFVGLAGSVFPLLVVAEGKLTPLLPVEVCFSIIMLGLFVQIAAKVSLGKSFGLIAANRGVKSSGPYRFLRHPMYAGYTITHIGIFLSFPSVRNALLYSIALGFQVIRILREERVLSRDPEYRALTTRVRYRLLPGIF